MRTIVSSWLLPRRRTLSPVLNGMTAPSWPTRSAGREYKFGFEFRVAGFLIDQRYRGATRAPAIARPTGKARSGPAAGATLRFLPPYSPDFNPIENAFARLKALLRKAAAPTIEGLWAAIGAAVKAFSPQECANYFAAAGYDAD